MKDSNDWTDTVETKKLLSFYVATKSTNPTKFEKTWNALSEVDKKVANVLLQNDIHPFEVLKNFLVLKRLLKLNITSLSLTQPDTNKMLR